MNKIRIFVTFVVLATLLTLPNVGSDTSAEHDPGPGMPIADESAPLAGLIVVDAGGPYSGDEGSAIALDGATASEPDDDPLTYAWTVDNNELCWFDTPSVLHPKLTCKDDGEFIATLCVNHRRDADVWAACTCDQAEITVLNVAPTCDETSPTLVEAKVDELITFSADFGDPGVLDTHTGEWDWDDDNCSACTVDEVKPSDSGSVRDQHCYSTTGTYTATLVIEDDFPESDECRYTVVVSAPGLRYLPLILKAERSFCEWPEHLAAPWQQELTAGEKGTVCLEALVTICDQLPEDGRFYFSSREDAVQEIKVDDELAILVGGREVCSHNFKSQEPVQPPYLTAQKVEIPRETMEEIAGQTITVQFRDVYGNRCGSVTDVYMIWVRDEIP